MVVPETQRDAATQSVREMRRISGQRDGGVQQCDGRQEMSKESRSTGGQGMRRCSGADERAAAVSSEALYLRDQELLLVRELLVCKRRNTRSAHPGSKCTGGRRVDAPSLSLWKSFRNFNNFSLFLRRMFSICGGFFGFATNTYAEPAVSTLETSQPCERGYGP